MKIETKEQYDIYIRELVRLVRYKMPIDERIDDLVEAISKYEGDVE